MTDEQEIWQAVQAANSSWQSGNAEGARGVFHPSSILMSPWGEVLQESRDEIIEGYQEYTDAFRIQAFEEGEPDIRVYEETALVVYPYVLRLFEEGKKRTIEGKEMLVFHRSSEGWQVVCRMPLGEDERPEEN